MNRVVISVIGLGYVGLPVAIAFGKKHKVIGFDINLRRIVELKSGHDSTGEITTEELLEFGKTQSSFSSNISDLVEANFHIVAVPTPTNKHNKPDLTPMFLASETIGKILKKGDIVVYESTVYPGVCEEECLPILEAMSGLRGGIDFKIGYSPERINPGDKEHTFTKILKIVSAQDTESLKIISEVYSSVVTAGVYEASSIRVAEAAKVIENTQRDLNIALMNELSMICNKMGINTHEVINAASTKWNFLKFKPGLVGGHCIGVDPYYLTYKAEALGYHPQVILAGRKINDSMGKYVAEKCVKELILAGHTIKGCIVTILGLTFKENCPDLRNSKVKDIIDELKEYGINVQAYDPLANLEDVERNMGVKGSQFNELKKAHAVILAVVHAEFAKLSIGDLKEISVENSVLIDVKNHFKPHEIQAAGIKYWSL